MKACKLGAGDGGRENNGTKCSNVTHSVRAIKASPPPRSCPQQANKKAAHT